MLIHFSGNGSSGSDKESPSTREGNQEKQRLTEKAELKEIPKQSKTLNEKMEKWKDELGKSIGNPNIGWHEAFDLWISCLGNISKQHSIKSRLI